MPSLLQVLCFPFSAKCCLHVWFGSDSGESFHINVSGETGIGKSTLCDSLFNTTFDSAPETHKEAGVRLKAHTYELQESNVNLKLTLVDTVSEE